MASEIKTLEMHGTGTGLGDPIEASCVSWTWMMHQETTRLPQQMFVLICFALQSAIQMNQQYCGRWKEAPIAQNP